MPTAVRMSHTLVNLLFIDFQMSFNGVVWRRKIYCDIIQAHILGISAIEKWGAECSALIEVKSF